MSELAKWIKGDDDKQVASDAALAIRTLLTSPASGERDAVIKDGFIGDDFAEVYRILRDEGTTHAALTAALSNNLNVIIAALARASAGGSA